MDPRRLFGPECRDPVLTTVDLDDRSVRAVVVRRGRETAKVQLSARFQEAVDRAAMRAGRGSSDAYLADWKRSEGRPCGEDIHAEAAAEAARIEARFSDEQLEELIRSKGLSAGS